MNMSHNAQLRYQLSPLTSFLRDGNDERSARENLSLEAKVRSGDFFVTLATTLDELSRSETDWRTRTSLEDVVSDLIYLQDNYTITKNKQPE
jgi:hypothetical protein